MPDEATVCPSCGYNASAQTGKFPMALPPGTVLNGRYILGKVLGQGGFGITYIAQDHKTGSLVAVKEYFPDTMAARTDGHSVSAYTGQREENFLYGKECFLNEAKTLAEFIGNPNIVRVHSYFEENNTAYFVMDYVQGTSFQDYLKQHGRLSWPETKRILEPVIGALASVHSKGVIHRDVTPDNIYITNDGTVKLLDFGAARYSLGDKSRSLDVVLKHGYAPREQYSRHGRQGPYTDVYALGATFYYALTGRLPPDSIDRQDEDEFILPSSLGVKLPAKAEDALCKALAVSAQDRFHWRGKRATLSFSAERKGTWRYPALSHASFPCGGQRKQLPKGLLFAREAGGAAKMVWPAGPGAEKAAVFVCWGCGSALPGGGCGGVPERATLHSAPGSQFSNGEQPGVFFEGGERAS